ncbi:hypothetical protein [Agathobacter rectalis]|uniref:hypothetical protein n=1 Tax=Agathobacter rectalis TaxID=39491 RepID=UPI0027D26F3B|nr:hypothetical protein [Agathobacter rectalis]
MNFDYTLYLVTDRQLMSCDSLTEAVELQNKLYLTAKKCDSRRFHALYDKVYRDDVLFEAYSG